MNSRLVKYRETLPQSNVLQRIFRLSGHPTQTQTQLAFLRTYLYSLEMVFYLTLLSSIMYQPVGVFVLLLLMPFHFAHFIPHSPENVLLGALIFLSPVRCLGTAISVHQKFCGHSHASVQLCTLIGHFPWRLSFLSRSFSLCKTFVARIQNGILDWPF